MAPYNSEALAHARTPAGAKASTHCNSGQNHPAVETIIGALICIAALLSLTPTASEPSTKIDSTSARTKTRPARLHNNDTDFNAKVAACE